ncbi:MAG: hypothetical protein FWG02_06925 [Holophagaceae bacterium]|nr:hypothetical protein [Holophagaceae bacterium]
MAGDFWNHRELFREWVAEAKTKLGTTNSAVVSEYLGLAPTTLYKYLSKNATHKPSTDVLKRLGDFLGRDYRLLMDVPDRCPDGLEEDKWAEATERDKLIARAMFADITADQLTESEKDEIFRAYKEAKDRVLRLREVFKKDQR